MPSLLVERRVFLTFLAIFAAYLFASLLELLGGYIALFNWAITLAIGAIALIVVGIRVDRRRYRVEAGLCTACGYDMRESNNGCPECGTRKEIS